MSIWVAAAEGKSAPNSLPAAPFDHLWRIRFSIKNLTCKFFNLSSMIGQNKPIKIQHLWGQRAYSRLIAKRQSFDPGGARRGYLRKPSFCRGSQLSWEKKFICSICRSWKVNQKRRKLKFETKKPPCFGFLGVNRDLGEVFEPPSFTQRVPGYRKPIYKSAWVISRCQGMPGLLRD